MLRRLAERLRRFAERLKSARRSREAREDELEKEGPFAGRPMP